MLNISHLTVSVGTKTIIRDFSYRFEKNKVYVIMGPNGSGKSTLAHAIMGNPLYTVSPGSSIVFKGEEVSGLSPDKRAQKGMFLTFQTPPSLSGVSVFQLLRSARRGEDVFALHQKLDGFAKKLKIKQDLMDRSFNEGASGGEKKKMEVLQAATVDPSLAVFDEIDTGVDVDALRLISAFLRKTAKEKTLIFITHYSRILSGIKTDRVLVLKNGSLDREGGPELIEHIEADGYETRKKQTNSTKKR